MKKPYVLFLILFVTSLIARAQSENPLNEKAQRESSAGIVVYTKTGEVYKGLFISQNKDFLIIETKTLGTVKIPTQRIKKIESGGDDSQFEIEKESLEQINAVRYMVGTSAFNYEKGGNYLRNNPMTYHRGISDNFSFGVGSSLWALVLGIPTIYINPHYTTQLRKNIHFKLGLDAFAGTSFEAGGAAAAILNTGITVGEPDLNLTGSVYYGAISEVQGLNPFYSLAGMARISKKLMVLSEAFFIPTESDGNLSFVFYGGRYLTETASYDLGFLYNPEIAEFIPIGIPFLAITVKL